MHNSVAAFWVLLQVQLGYGGLIAHFVTIHNLFIFSQVSRCFQSLINFAATFLVLCLVACNWIKNYCRHFDFYVYRHFSFWEYNYGSNEKLAQQREKNFFSSSQKSWLGLWSILRRHCTWNHAAYLIKLEWTGILANRLWRNWTFLKLKVQVRTANPKDEQVRLHMYAVGTLKEMSNDILL